MVVALACDRWIPFAISKLLVARIRRPSHLCNYRFHLRPEGRQLSYRCVVVVVGDDHPSISS